MIHFKIGDTVRRIVDTWNGMNIGDVDTITAVEEGDLGGTNLTLKKYGIMHSEDSFELVTSKTIKPKIDKREQAIYKRLAKVKRPNRKVFKKGDKVRIRSDLAVNRKYDGSNFSIRMNRYKGDETIIHNAEDDENGNYYYLDIDGGIDDWSGEMLKLVEGV